MINLSNANAAASVPSSVTVPAAATSANFTVTTNSVTVTTVGNVTGELRRRHKVCDLYSESSASSGGAFRSVPQSDKRSWR
jgi:hypothetical protein